MVSKQLLFFHLTAHENHSFGDAYVFLEKIFGIDGRQTRRMGKHQEADEYEPLRNGAATGRFPE